MQTNVLRCLCAFLAAASGLLPLQAADAPPASTIRHSYLVLGGKTAIIGEDGKAQWEYRGGSRDGFVLPGGNVLIAFADRVEEVVPAGDKLNQVVFTYTRSKDAVADGVEFTVEWSENLASWSAAGVASSVMTDEAATQQIKALVPVGVTRRFVHLKVMKP